MSELHLPTEGPEAGLHENSHITSEEGKFCPSAGCPFKDSVRERALPTQKLK